MRKIYLVASFLLATFTLKSQQTPKLELLPSQVVQLNYLGESQPVINNLITPEQALSLFKKPAKEIQNFVARENLGGPKFNPNPQIDPLWQGNNFMHRSGKTPDANTVIAFDGTNFNGVQPPDPCLDISSTHVVQMVNGGGGTTVRVFDKQGNLLAPAFNMNSIWNQFGVTGLGDPIVMYDELADRWFFSEFAAQGNRLLIGISTTNNPLGSFYAYQYTTTDFPDYPKYSIWPNGYFATTNESGPSVIYAMQRDSMLVGAPALLQKYTVPSLNGFGFQALTPVDFDGPQLPNATTKASFWRHNDDEAHGGANPNTDRVEYWELDVDFTTATSSVLSGPTIINVTDFDSDLNGFFAFSAIQQPNTNTRLDPLREVFMNRMHYWNFGSHETIVGCHVTDVNGNDHAGIRWYEFRKMAGATSWSLYQEGTYAPDADSRWMAAISIDGSGNIGMAYNVSSSNTFPSLRYTGRTPGDAPGTMTLAEVEFATGGGSNTSNRYGDYASMSIDPLDHSTFWFTGEYNPTSAWGTKIVAFTLNDSCNALTVNATTTGSNTCYTDSNGVIVASATGGQSSLYQYSLNGVDFQSSGTFNNLPPGSYNITVQDSVGCTAISANIQVDGPPPFTTTSSVEPISCNGSSDGEFTITTSGGQPPFSYSLNGGFFQSNSTFGNLSAGVYNITIRDAQNCETAINPVVLVDPAPIVLAFTTTASNGTDGVIDVQVSGGTPPYFYSLDNVNYQNTSVFNGLTPGSYTVYVKDFNNCLGFEAAGIEFTGINEANASSSVLIYPNPVQNELTIELNSKKAKDSYKISLYDLSGKLLVSESVSYTINGNKLHTLDFSNYAKGLYNLTIECSDSKETFSIEKLK